MATNYFTWDNTNQQYTLNTSILDTNNFSLTVKAYDKEKVFLGDINIKTHFQEYVLKSNQSISNPLGTLSSFQVNREVIVPSTGSDEYSITYSSPGILVNNNYSYTLNFNIITPLLLSAIRGIRLSQSDYLTRIQNSPYWETLTATSSNFYIYFNIGDVDGIIQTSTNNYYFQKGAVLWSQNDNDTINWYMQRVLQSGTNYNTIKIEGSNPRLQAPAQSFIYKISAEYVSI